MAFFNSRRYEMPTSVCYLSLQLNVPQIALCWQF